MLYLNVYLVTVSVGISNLTLTSVVFEFLNEYSISTYFINLTLTSVVFELDICSTWALYDGI